MDSGDGSETGKDSGGPERLGRPGGSGSGGGSGDSGRTISPRLVVLAGRKGTPSLLPFVAVLLVLGVVGLLALLFLNTELNKGAFTIKQQKATATRLQQQSEQIQESLNGLDGPAALASAASQMGMVPNPNPAFLAPRGSVLGSPTPAPTPSSSEPKPTPAPSPTATPTPPPTPTGGGR